MWLIDISDRNIVHSKNLQLEKYDEAYHKVGSFVTTVYGWELEEG